MSQTQNQKQLSAIEQKYAAQLQELVDNQNALNTAVRNVNKQMTEFLNVAIPQLLKEKEDKILELQAPIKQKVDVEPKK